MLFRNDKASLRLDIARYEFPDVDPGSEDNNWLVVRATWIDENGGLVKDSNSCLQTFELQACRRAEGAEGRDPGPLCQRFSGGRLLLPVRPGGGGPLPVPCVLLPAHHDGTTRRS